MKAIMISIKPKWVALEMNGIKNIEVRNTAPKDWKDYLSGKTKEMPKPIDVYIYCSKGNKKNWHLIEVVDTDTGWKGYEYDYYIGSKEYLEHCLESKVVAKFTLNKVEEIDSWYHLSKDDFAKTCLTISELVNYIGNFEIGYAWHISNLVIFDKPKELSEFFPYCKDTKCEYRKNHCSICHREPLTKAPQSWCYIESEEEK